VADFGLSVLISSFVYVGKQARNFDQSANINVHIGDLGDTLDDYRLNPTCGGSPFASGTPSGGVGVEATCDMKG